MPEQTQFEGNAVILAPGALQTQHAKTTHGLLRGGTRYRIVAVLDADAAGQDAGTVLDGQARGIPVVATLDEARERSAPRPDTVIVGIATGGGRLPPELRALLLQAAQRGMHIVNGLHEFASDDPQIVAAAAANGSRIVDVRKPKPRDELHFWSGEIANVRAPRIAVLGTDCAMGKRTTARFLVDACNADGLRAEMIYTGQTGWMQGGRYGFILDSVANDFVAGELEHAIVTCDAARKPDVIIVEGQSGLRNPSGPCGSELLVSGQARGVILQHAPGQIDFKGHPGWRIPPLPEEIDLIRYYGARVLAVTLNGERLSSDELIAAQRDLEQHLGLPVIRPLQEGMGALVPVLRSYLC